jgi:hypothetical protein
MLAPLWLLCATVTAQQAIRVSSTCLGATTLWPGATADKLPFVVSVVLQSRPFGVALLIGGWDSEGPVL